MKKLKVSTIGTLTPIVEYKYGGYRIIKDMYKSDFYYIEKVIFNKFRFVWCYIDVDIETYTPILKSDDILIFNNVKDCFKILANIKYKDYIIKQNK